MPAPRALTIDLEGQQVKVYRNLQNGLFSVQLRGVCFKVSERARQRVLTQRQRNVHAYAIGTFTTAAQATATELISYNPYTTGHFFCVEDAAPIHHAPAVVLRNGKHVFALINPNSIAMENELKALHRAVEILLKARRDAKRTANALRKSGGGLGGSGWDRMHFIDQLQLSADSATKQLQSAETDVLAAWAVLNTPPE